MRVAQLLITSIIILLTSCGGKVDFIVGPTDVSVKPEASTFVWPDLPEALKEMQKVTEAPNGTFDVLLRVYPPWHAIGIPGHACEYEQVLDVIEIRARYPQEETTANSCLGHELAHRWAHLSEGIYSSYKHDAVWKQRRNKLNIAATNTFLHR